MIAVRTPAPPDRRLYEAYAYIDRGTFKTSDQDCGQGAGRCKRHGRVRESAIPPPGDELITETGKAAWRL
jgi:hypothetical protein